MKAVNQLKLTDLCQLCSLEWTNSGTFVSCSIRMSLMWMTARCKKRDSGNWNYFLSPSSWRPSSVETIHSLALSTDSVWRCRVRREWRVTHWKSQRRKGTSVVFFDIMWILVQQRQHICMYTLQRNHASMPGAKWGPGSCGHQVIVGCLRPQRHLLKSHAIKDVFVQTAFCRNTAFNCSIILPAQMIETFERHAMHQVSWPDDQLFQVWQPMFAVCLIAKLDGKPFGCGVVRPAGANGSTQ